MGSKGVDDNGAEQYETPQQCDTVRPDNQLRPVQQTKLRYAIGEN